MVFDRPSDPTRDLSPGDRERILNFHNLRPGELFARRYRIVEALGHGGAGEVYRVRDEVAGEEVALKVLFPGSGMITLERLRREVRLVRDLHHPGILRIYEIGTADGLLYLVSEVLEGETLKERLAREGKLEVPEARRILIGVLEGLRTAHDAGVVHRDIKPGNVFLTRDDDDSRSGRVVLLDFGLAREASSEGLTTVGRFVGTPEYSAPEQIQGKAEIGPAADLYSCGVLAWEMLSGKPPYQGDSAVAILTAHLDGVLPPLRKELAGVPALMKSVVVHLLQKEPTRRPRSAGGTLARLARGGVVSALAARAGLVSYGLVRDWWRRVLLAAAAVLLLAGTVMWSLEPVSVSWRDRELTLETRAGFSIRRGPFVRDVAQAALDSPSFGPVRGVWVALDPPSEPTPDLVDGRFASPGLLFLPAPWFSARSALNPNNHLGYMDAAYEIPTGRYTPSILLPLENAGSEPDLVLAIAFQSRPNYPARVDYIDRSGQTVAHYQHPGWFEKLYLLLPRSGHHPLVLATGTNNLVGPRPVLVGLPCDQRASGQAPPFTASSGLPSPGGWYLFLPYSPYGYHFRVRLDGDQGRIVGPGEFDLSFDARTGVPIEARDRGGLSVEDWVLLRDDVLNALYVAAGYSRVGRFEAAAHMLESCVKGRDGPPELLSIPRYQAARYWMKVSSSMGERGYERALLNVTTALGHEPRVPRYRLLQAELAVRLGRDSVLRTQLAQYARYPENKNYAYEWLLINRLAGAPVPSERFLTNWNPGIRNFPWPRLILEVLAYDRGDFDEAIGTFDAAVGPVYDVHRYWNARMLLSKLQPARALERVDSDHSEDFKVGYALPLETLRLRARTMLDSGGIPESQVEAALAELARFELDAASDLHSLVMLPFAREDMALAAEALGREAIAREIRARPARAR